MARQNIDEKWKSDPRRKALAKRLGSERIADGMRVEINWLVLDHKGQPVPLKEFKFVEDWQAWIECGLAETKGQLVHIAGADRYAEFFDKQKENGKRGGRPKETQENPVEPTTNPSETQKKPEKPSISFSSSSSVSSSFSSSEVTNSSNSTNAGIAAYCERYKMRWGINPPIQGKDTGIMKRLVKSFSPDRLCLYLDAYFQMPDAGVVKAKHPLNLFELKMNEVVVFADSGQFTTQTQARQADGMATNHLLMEKLKREGK